VVAGIMLGILTLGIGLFVIVPAALVVAVLWFIWSIQATIAASKGDLYRYPLSLRLIKN
jgi:uncharacterized protein